MSIYPEDVLNGVRNGSANLLVADDGQLKIVIGNLGLNPETFIQEAVADGWGRKKITRTIAKMMVPSDVRDREYELAVQKILELVPIMRTLFVRKQKKEKNEGSFELDYRNTGTN